MNTKFVISLIGAPASGKGYIADCLVKELETTYGYRKQDVTDISTGALIRREIKGHTPLGEELKANMKEGGLAPDSMVNKMLITELHRSQAKVIILDGYPRTVAQVQAFNKLMKDFNRAVIFRDTPKDIILDRVKNRRICADCGAAQEVSNGKCEHCGGRLIKRKDDEVLPERLAEYEEMTKPAVLELQKEGHNFFFYDGTAEGADIARSFLAANKSYL